MKADLLLNVFNTDKGVKIATATFLLLIVTMIILG